MDRREREMHEKNTDKLTQGSAVSKFIRVKMLHRNMDSDSLLA